MRTQAAAALGQHQQPIPTRAVPSTGKHQPRLPTWRANAIVTYRANEKLTASVSVRYSSGQFGQLNNTDTNGFAYTGITSYVVADLIAKYKITKQMDRYRRHQQRQQRQVLDISPFSSTDFLCPAKV